MDITQLPFNQFIGIENCVENIDGIFQLPADPKYLNHVKTVHASALFALAEASSGEFLSRNLNIDRTKAFPILRRSEIKYRKPATGHVYTKGVYKENDWNKFHETYNIKMRALIAFQIEILDDNKIIVATAGFEWFVTGNKTHSS